MFSFFLPTARYEHPWSGQVLVLSPRELPTTHYYLEPRLAALPADAVDRGNSLSPETAGRIGKMPAGSFVVIVRHASAAVLHALLAQRGRLAGVAFLVDDDLPNAWRCRELPLAYAWRTSWRYFSHARLLARVCDRMWVSTPALAERCPVGPADAVRVMPPLWHGPAPEVAEAGNRQWFYHGTASHREEMEWLLPVVARVQSRCPEAWFEIVGNAAVARMYRPIPRVRVRPQLPWPEYYRQSLARRMALGVAPLLERAFNRYRAPVKVFDIARLGAVGVYSDDPVFGSAVRHGETGCLVGRNPGDWAEVVEELLRDDGRRAKMFSAAWQSWRPDLERAAKSELFGSPARQL